MKHSAGTWPFGVSPGALAARLPLVAALLVASSLGFRVGRFDADSSIRCATPLFLAAAILIAIGLGLLCFGLLLLIARRSRPIGRALLFEAAWTYPAAIVLAFAIGRFFP